MVAAVSGAGWGGAGDARTVVREGLRRVVASHGEPPDDAAVARAWVNRLLDETGSDRRGLVQLLLRVRADGVLGELPPGPLAPAAWAPVRARLAFGYASATYLDADMARWAVDAWAYALGVIAADGLWAPPPPAAVLAPALTALPNTPGAVRPVATVAPAAPAAAAGGGGRAGKTPGRMRRAVARANAPPVHNPFPANFDRLAGGVFMGLVVLSAGAMWMGIATRHEAGGLELPDAPSYQAEPAPPAAPAIVRAAPHVAEAGAIGRLDRMADEDTLRLRDGTVRTGRVARVTREAVVLYDLWSDRQVGVDLDDVTELRLRGGAVLPFGGHEAAPPRDTLGRRRDLPAATGEAAPRARGVGGRYAVRQSLLDVEGTESCDAVAAAVRQAAARPTVEVVDHRPGETTFALASRPGVRGTVDADGRFRTEAIRGVRDGVHYWFRMSGRFDGRGFRAEAESATDAVLKYGSVQRCRVTAALDARRLP